MHELVFRDRDGNSEALPVQEGTSVASVLLGARIPPTSVVVTEDGDPVAGVRRITAQHEYEATLLEGYDIETIRAQFAGQVDDDIVSVNRRLSFGSEGEMACSQSARSLGDHETYVEETLLDTLTYHDLVTKGDTIVVGASGGLDSTTLLRVLSNIESDLPSFDLLAVTVEDFLPVEDARDRTDIAETVESLGFDHRFVPASAIEETYGLACSPETALTRLADTDYRSRLGSLAPGIIQRMVRQTARTAEADAIYLGSHVTELIGGILNAWFTGAEVQRRAIPEHPMDDLSYRYPLAYLSKRDLYLYRYSKTGQTHRLTEANPWDWFSDEQSFHYYLADMLQEIWPGVEHWLYASHNDRISTAWAEISFDTCANCGKTKYADDFAEDGRCEVCLALAHADCLST